jgi:hypothetical protein
MPPVHGSKAKLLLSGYDVSTSMQDATAGLSVDSADASTWGTTNKRYAVSNIIDGTFTGSGVWEATGATPGSIDELLHTKLAGNHVATYMPAGDGFGNRARLIGGYETSFDIPSPTDDIVAFEFEIQSSAGFLHKARVLRPVGADNSINGNSNGTALDELGAVGSTTGGLGAALHVRQKAGGAGTLTVKVQHSPDNSVWTDLLTFAGVTVAPAAQYLEVAGTVQRYLRALWTVTGGTWDIHVAAGRR